MEWMCISLLLSSILVKDLEDAIPYDIKDNIGVCKYGDDCTLNKAVYSTEMSHVQIVLDSMQTWSDNNKMVINSAKTKEMLISFRDVPSPDNLATESEQIKCVS